MVEAAWWRRFGAPIWQHRGLMGLLAIIAAVVALYAPTLHDPLHGDDFVAFTDVGTKPALQYIEDVFLFKDANFYWRPLGAVFHFEIYQAFGFDAFAFRVGGLLVFLATLVALYAFCVRERFGIAVALGAVLLFGLLPNHVVSVAWVTNTSRLMAVLFGLCGLLFLQVRSGRHWWREIAALVCFLAAALSDETAMALAPVPFLYATFIATDGRHLRAAAVRAAAYVIPVVVLLPLQFANTLNDEPRLATYGFGPHMITQAWALLGQLVLPLTPAHPVDIFLYDIPTAQWAAGLAALAAGAVLFVAGSNRVRFLLIWTALALAPFTLWGVRYTSPRYVYIAALPYAILLSWLLVQVLAVRLQPAVSRVALRAAAVGAVAAFAVVASQAVLARNDEWSRETEKYGVLTASLQEALDDVPSGTRVVIYYGNWFDFWATSVAQSIYADRSIRVMNVKRDRVDTGFPARGNNDLVLYFVGGKLVPIVPDSARAP